MFVETLIHTTAYRNSDPLGVVRKLIKIQNWFLVLPLTGLLMVLLLVPVRKENGVWKIKDQVTVWIS